MSGIRVDDLTLDGPDNGIRITSNPAHGGLVEDVVYQDICIRNAKSPIVFDTAFSFPGKGIELLPVYDDITLRNVRLAGGGKVQFNGFDATHRIGVTLDGVMALDKPDLYRAQAIHTDLTLGPGPVNLVFTGDDSIVTGKEIKAIYPPAPPSSFPSRSGDLVFSHALGAAADTCSQVNLWSVRMRILIVDDSVVMRKIVEGALRHAGLELTEAQHAANGAEGLAALEDAAARGELFDLILCDVHMPVLDGLGFLRRSPSAISGPAHRW